MRGEIVGKKAEEILERVFKDKKLRKWLRQFIYHGHGRVVERLSNKRLKLCDGCESDISAIIEEVALVTLGKANIGKKNSPYKIKPVKQKN